ncbi:MAG: hypothetical protein WBA22_07840 [Candidatus Methanofastidiosia archaeon]
MPYILSGVARDPDSLRHPGVSLHIDDILDGKTIQFGKYAERYPGSFILNYLLMTTMSIEPSMYGTIAFPIISCFLYIIGWYGFFSVYLGDRQAFLSMLLSIPALHYVKLHPSPQAVSTLLVLAAFILIISKSIVSKILGGVLFLFMLFVHPISPFLFLIFVGTAAAYGIVFKSKGSFSVKHFLFALGAVIVLLALVCAFSSFDVTLHEQVRKFLSLIFGTKDTNLGGFIFIYSKIFALNILIYLLIGIFALFFFLENNIFKIEIEKLKLRVAVHSCDKKQMTLITVSGIYIVFAIVSGIMNSPDLLERGLTFAVLMVTASISQGFAASRSWNRQKWRKRLFFPATLVVALVITYPVVAYSIEAYNSFPFSEKAGLDFLAYRVTLDGRTVAMSYEGQMAIYETDFSSTNFYILHGPQIWNLDYLQPDVFVYRQTGYYNAAIRWDKSFEQNRYYQYEIDLRSYNRIYYNHSFRIYLKSNIE